MLASDASSGYGLRADWWVMDEVAQWPNTPSARVYYTAISTAWPQTPGCRVVIITTAGSPAHWAYQLYRHAQDSNRWALSMTPGPPPWADPADIEAERQRLPESIFRRMFLNEWAEPEDRLMSVEDLQACTRHPDEPVAYADQHRPYLITVDIGLKRDHTAVVVSHRDNDTEARPLVIDRIHTWKGTPDRPVSIEEVRSPHRLAVSPVRQRAGPHRPVPGGLGALLH